MQVCANGARAVHEHPALSADPDVMARDCARAVAAGAGAIHIHPKDPTGAESINAVDVDRWVCAVRRRCPRTPVGVTTGAWAMPDVAARLRAIRAWRHLPDVASVNWHEDGADEVAATLMDRGIGVEAGIWHGAGLRAWAGSPVRSACLRVLIEVQDMSPVDARRTGNMLVGDVSDLEPRMPVLVHGEDRSTWAAIELAGGARRLRDSP